MFRLVWSDRDVYQEDQPESIANNESWANYATYEEAKRQGDHDKELGVPVLRIEEFDESGAVVKTEAL